MNTAPVGDRVGRYVEDTTSWLTVYPELRSRPELVRLMQKNRRVRHTVLKKLSSLIYVPDIRENGAARHALNLVYRHAKRMLIKYWQKRMDEAGLHSEMAQMVGAVRNLYMNMAWEIDPKKCGGFKWSEHDLRPEDRGTAGI